MQDVCCKGSMSKRSAKEINGNRKGDKSLLVCWIQDQVRLRSIAFSLSAHYHFAGLKDNNEVSTG